MLNLKSRNSSEDQLAELRVLERFWIDRFTALIERDYIDGVSAILKKSVKKDGKIAIFQSFARNFTSPKTRLYRPSI